MDRRNAASPAGALSIDDGARARPAQGKSLLPAGVTRRRRPLRAGRHGEHRRPRRRRGGARHLRLFGRRCGAHHGPQIGRDREHAGLSRPRRDGASRRSGADCEPRDSDAVPGHRQASPAEPRSPRSCARSAGPRAAPPTCSRWHRPRPEEPGAARRGGTRCARSRPEILAANERDMREARVEREPVAALLDRLRLDDERIEAMARGARGHRALPDPIGTRARRMDAARTAAHSARARAARRHRHHLREPPERHRRCRRAVPEIGQRGDPARRLGERALQRRHPSPAWSSGLIAAGPAGAPAIQLVPTTRPRGGRLHARRHGAIHRRHRAARRQEPDRAGAAGGARAGDRASRGRLPRLSSTAPPISQMARDIVLNAKMRRTGICGAAETLLVDRGCAATHLAPLVADAARGGLRGARRRGDAALDPRVEAGDRAGLVHRISRRHHRGARRRRCRRGDRAHPPLRLAAHRLRS